MKCNNPNHKCPGEIGGPYNECNQCGWRVEKEEPKAEAPAKTKVSTPTVENK